MVNVCCVDGCVQTKDVIYFNVPNSRTLRKKWLDAFKSNCKVSNHSVVCSKHFLEDQYETVRGKKRLKAKVVPSVFDHISKPEVEKSPKRDVNNEDEAIERDRRKSEKEPKKRKSEEKKNNSICTEESVESVKIGDNVDSIVKRTEPTITTDCEANKDIEDIITNYHIQVPINRTKVIEQDETQKNEENEEIEDLITNFHIKQNKNLNGEENSHIIDVDNLKDPVFIEVSVDKGEQNNQDCVMLLESVQCEVDPTSLMLEDPPEPDPQPEIGPDIEDDDDDDDDDDVVDLGEKKEDPISLLTSSDEDDVILQEPKIDTVEVSDETDEDDMPLVKLVENPTKSKKKTKRKTKDNNIDKIMWGMYEYYCVECHFRTTSKSEFKVHSVEHPTVLQICQMCGYTTASKAQFLRHKKKHSEDRKFKCHLCDYKARHNMSLIYHLKTHDCVKLVNAKKGFKCEKCGFISDVKVELLKHIRLCCSASRKYVCDKCDYASKRKSDLNRHKMRRHKELCDDEEYVPPGWAS